MFEFSFLGFGQHGDDLRRVVGNVDDAGRNLGEYHQQDEPEKRAAQDRRTSIGRVAVSARLRAAADSRQVAQPMRHPKESGHRDLVAGSGRSCVSTSCARGWARAADRGGLPAFVRHLPQRVGHFTFARRAETSCGLEQLVEDEAEGIDVGPCGDGFVRCRRRG